MLDKLNNNIDRLLAIGALLFAAYQLLRIGIERPNPIMLAVFFFSVLYLLLRNKIKANQNLHPLRASPSIRKINHIVFILSLCASIWILRDSLYFRPMSYFLVSLIAAASIMWEILYSVDSNNSQSLILLKIIALGIIFRAGIFFEFPSILGSDPWLHNMVIEQTISSGHIVDFLNDAMNTVNSYSILPVFHIDTAITQIITSLSIPSSIFVSVGFFETLSCLFIFLIARKMLGIKAGLLSALVFCLCDFSIVWGTQIITMSLGIGFVAMLLYLMLVRGRTSIADVSVLLLISAALILTHTVAAFTMLVMLICILIGTRLYKRSDRYDTEHETIVSTSLVILFLVGLVAWWMIVPPQGGASFFDAQVLKLKYVMEAFGQLLVATPEVGVTMPYVARLFNNSGYSLLVGLGMFGSLIYFRPGNRSLRPIILAFIAAGLLVIQVINIEGFKWAVITSRWIVFQYMALSILAIAAIIGLSSVIRNNMGKLLMVPLVLLLILFPMTTNNASNTDSPLFRYDIHRTAYTESELTSIRTLPGILDAEPVTDLYFAGVWLRTLNRSEYLHMQASGNRVFIARKYDLFHPEYNDRHKSPITDIRGARLGRYLFESSPIVIADYIKQLEADKQALIYSSNTVSVWQMP